MDKNKRMPYVAGKFYPGTSDEIIKGFEHYLDKEKEDIDYSLAENYILGAILPHAGHVYCGYESIHFFEILRKSMQEVDTFIIMHPLHQGGHFDVVTDSVDYWNTPLGDVKIDAEFIKAADIEKMHNMLCKEHSAEVLLPFLQYFANKPFSIVPIGFAKQNFKTAVLIANKINKARLSVGKKICVLASSDFNHFETPEMGFKKDQFVVEKIKKMDTTGIEREINTKFITVCGYGPIMSLMEYTKIMDDHPEINILKRGHSGEVYPSDTVVDYISVLFSSKYINNE